LGQISEISSQIGVHLEHSLGISAEGYIEKAGLDLRPVNPEAFKLYALGKSAMRNHTGQKLADITRYFQAAIELDPDYFAPYIGMAEAYIFDVNRGYMSSTQASQKVKEYVLKAEKLNPGSGEVSGIMGIIHFLDFDFRNAVPYFEESMEKSPNFSLAYEWYSFTLEFMGDLEKAQEIQKKAAILDPLNAFYDYILIMNHLYQHEYNKAEALINKKLTLNPNDPEFLWVKAVALTEQGRYQEAHEVLLKRKFGLETNFVSGYVFAKIGQEDRARQVVKNMLDKEFVSPSQLAVVYCGLEEYDLALEQIEKAYLTQDGWFKWILLSSMADPVKNDPRYLSILEQLPLGIADREAASDQAYYK
jgi:tetratricopeptide (TPR) repeat protein